MDSLHRSEISHSARASLLSGTMTPLMFTFFYYALVESSDKPVVTFTPDWKDIFIYESVTITCNTASTAQDNHRYFWYKDDKPIKEHRASFTIESAEDTHLGQYRCRTNEQKSNPARLGVVNAPLILQRPLVIYRGGPLTLRCHSYPGYNATNTTFYKNRTILQFSATDDKLHIAKVDNGTAGMYRCTKQIYNGRKLQNNVAETQVSVEDVIYKKETPQTFPWIPAVIVLPITLIIGLLLFKFRYKLCLLTRGGLQSYPVTEPAGPNKVEENVYYSEIDDLQKEPAGPNNVEENVYYSKIDDLQKAHPPPSHLNDDYSIIYSLVTHTHSLNTEKEAPERTIYEVIKI